MKRLLAALLLATWPASAQVDITSAPCNMTDGSCAQARLVANGAGSPFSPRSITKVAVSDNFNRANGDLGANWLDVASPVTIYSNGARRTSAGTGYAYWQAATFSSDQYAEGYCNFAGIPNSWLLLMVRTSVYLPSPALNGYAFIRSNTAFDRKLVRAASGSFVILASCPDVSAKPIVRIEVVGTTISVYELSAHGGTKTLRCSATDSTYTSGPPGISAGGQFGGGDLDDFYAGDL